ncbi:MAG: DUF202 domain-containing protein [Intrasporangium sp.]|uniref:DUF202 domain-containing protein n=1 Tax=Intrasporangium sp. TaxID=1925024 RepID=UPI0026478212|nr:DUF202 domain-containing protein [Intrasporangium sp.]MDN5795839.1 DUF202 domain-containing protein [Intrasporangium sp.]
MSGPTWHDRDDPGLQPERTELAWQRTMISFLAASLLMMRFVDRFGEVVLAMVGVACVSAAYILLGTRRRTRHIAPHFPDAPVPIALSEVLVVTAATLLLGTLGLWVVVDLLLTT